MEAFKLRYRQSGLNHRKQKYHKKAQLQDLDKLIKEKRTSMREEFMRLNGIKDPNANIWKMRTSILGDRHKAPDPVCIKHPDTGELINSPEEIKKVTLNHNIKILTKTK